MLAGLGAFHGLNPAMGWLFAVALGLHRQSRGIVLKSLIPIARGHTVSIGIVALAVVVLGLVADQRFLEIAAGAVLLDWATYHAAYGHRRRVRVGMKTGMAGLGLWSFPDGDRPWRRPHAGAGAHSVVPLGNAGKRTDGGGFTAHCTGRDRVHMAAMLSVTLAIAVCVYEWLGLSFLRRGWINFDLIWIAARAITGIILVV